MYAARKQVKRHFSDPFQEERESDNRFLDKEESMLGRGDIIINVMYEDKRKI